MQATCENGSKISTYSLEYDQVNHQFCGLSCYCSVLRERERERERECFCFDMRRCKTCHKLFVFMKSAVSSSVGGNVCWGEVGLLRGFLQRMMCLSHFRGRETTLLWKSTTDWIDSIVSLASMPPQDTSSVSLPSMAWAKGATSRVRLHSQTIASFNYISPSVCILTYSQTIASFNYIWPSICKLRHSQTIASFNYILLFVCKLTRSQTIASFNYISPSVCRLS